VEHMVRQILIDACVAYIYVFRDVYTDNVRTITVDNAGCVASQSDVNPVCAAQGNFTRP
jgi:hypothetical protein